MNRGQLDLPLSYMSLQVQPMPAITPTKPPLLNVYARNVELHTFKRGWSHKFLATRLGITPYSLTRIRYGRGRYLDAEVFASMLEVFDCQPNDLLLPQPGIDYTIPE